MRTYGDASSYRRMLLFISLLIALFFVVSFSSAQADVITESGAFSLEHDLEEYDKLVQDGGATEWTESQAELYSAIRGAAFTDTLENEFDSGLSPVQQAMKESWESSAPETEFGDVQEHDIEQYIDDLPEGGSAEDEIGGQIADLDFAFGWVAAPVLIPLQGVLVYEDITSGSNDITRGLLSSLGDYETVASEGGVGAEAMRWQHFPECDAEGVEGEIACVFKRKPPDSLPTGESLEAEGVLPYNRGEHSEVPKNEPRTGEQYFIEAKVEGHWYASVEGCLEGLKPGFSGELDPWPDWLQADGTGLCYEEQVSGWPQNLKHVATYIYAGEPSYCYGPGDGYYCYSHEEPSLQTRYSVVGERSLSRMHMGKLKHSTKAEVEKLEDEGRIGSTQSFAPLTTRPELESALPRVIKEMKQGAGRTLEKGVEHATKGGLEDSPSEESSRFHEAEPAKPTGQLPAEPGVAEVPDCFLTSMTGHQCAGLLEEQGFTKVEIDTRTWEQAEVTLPAEAVISVDPAAGSSVETSTKLDVDQNPSVAGMPLVIPTPHTGGETATEYDVELEKLGFTKVSTRTRVESDIDTHVGPDDVASVSPEVGTGTNPDGSTDIEVEVNPEDAPIPGETGGGIAPPHLPGIHVPSFTVLCTKFPFGVPCWMYEEFSLWSTTAVVPKWEIPIEWKALGWHEDFIVSLSPFEGAMEVIRPVLIAVSTIGLVMLFYSFAVGGSPGTGGSDDDDNDSGNGI